MSKQLTHTKTNTGPVKKKKRDLSYRGSGKGKKRYYSGAESATMRFKPWGVVEDCIVLDHKMNDHKLSSELGRSVRAIQIRRCRLKKQNLEEKDKSQNDLV